LARQDPAELLGNYSFCLRRLQSPALFDLSLSHFDQPAFVPWDRPTLRLVYQSFCRLAEMSHAVAQTAGGVDAEEAWCAAAAATLGWLAMSAVDSVDVGRCLEHEAFARRPREIERDCWGQDHPGIARRLAQAWHLPDHFAAIAGHLGLPVETAEELGAKPRLFLVIQLAVALLREHADPLQLPCARPCAELADRLELAPAQLELLEGIARKTVAEPRAPGPWEAPSQTALLRDVLVLAAENRRIGRSHAVERLDQRLDLLQTTLEKQDAAFAERLEVGKLGAMAEFAAGAGHEINNPLAVISGQAQYLIRSLEEATPIQRLLHAETENLVCGGGVPAEHSTLRMSPPRLRESLQKVIQQVQRIHDLLRQLMLFARPPRPQKKVTDMVALVHEVLTAHSELATEHKVRVDSPPLGLSVLVLADPAQLRLTLDGVIKNAIQAAGDSGWIAVRFRTESPEVLQVIIEDSGTGPGRRQREHLFEPFYSGREAGRGHGLGLSIAWRLAREQGGRVRFVPLPHGPTRFEISVPLNDPLDCEPSPSGNGRVTSHVSGTSV
jgi:signal transduction histidine kinase